MNTTAIYEASAVEAEHATETATSAAQQVEKRADGTQEALPVSRLVPMFRSAASAHAVAALHAKSAGKADELRAHNAEKSRLLGLVGDLQAGKPLELQAVEMFDESAPIVKRARGLSADADKASDFAREMDNNSKAGIRYKTYAHQDAAAAHKKAAETNMAAGFKEKAQNHLESEAYHSGKRSILENDKSWLAADATPDDTALTASRADTTAANRYASAATDAQAASASVKPTHARAHHLHKIAAECAHMAGDSAKAGKHTAMAQKHVVALEAEDYSMPMDAKEAAAADAALEASGTSEGAKLGWEQRGGFFTRGVGADNLNRPHSDAGGFAKREHAQVAIGSSVMKSPSHWMGTKKHQRERIEEVGATVGKSDEEALEHLKLKGWKHYSTLTNQ